MKSDYVKKNMPYRGRFAPSPTGPLHFGSLVAAVGSYLDAKINCGVWLVRIDDLDTPRVVPGAADNILRTLDALGMLWHGKTLYQSTRIEAYRAALDHLRARNLIYSCACTRREIADSAVSGIDGYVYPGTCRDGLPPGKLTRAWRVDVRGSGIAFDDTIQGHRSQDIEREIGDFVLLRADGIYAYQLATVVDDASQGITNVVRGADLIDSTPRQIYLQRLLNLTTPRFAHLPVAANDKGEKLSKQTRAPTVDITRPAQELVKVMKFLGFAIPNELAHATTSCVWEWCIEHWSLKHVLPIRSTRIPT
jgi:glutamyl-Q tRNA(Asp) synthetase